MGYDNECVVNIQSLPGEYFCPVCRTLVYPNEALQAQCTHLFCKPCLAYVVATTHACSYDGYLVTEADSKPLVESSKELAETIGKVAVHCLYQRSGCQWQGTLAESTAHCTGCNYGNSPVVCNRCGTQIIHRQVQEHAQICPGLQPQAQAVENAQAQPVSAANQTGTQNPSSAVPATSTSAVLTVAAPSAPASTAASGQAQVQPGAVAPTPEQWYQQQQLQYQQYYQQYPGYDPYHQQYQQYAQYQPQAYPQYPQPQMQAAPQPYMQQPQPQPQPQPGQPQAQVQAYPQQQPQPHVPSQVPQMPAQPPFIPPQQPHPHAQAPTHPPPQGQVAGQPYPQPQPHAAQARPPPQLQAPPQHQQPVQQQMPHAQPHPQHMPYPQPQMQPQPQPIPQMQPQPQPIPQMQPQMQPQPQPIPQMQPQMQPIPQMQPQMQPIPQMQPQMQPSYPQPIPGPPQQRPTHVHPQQHAPQIQSQFPPQPPPPQMRPTHSQMSMPVQQQPAMPPPQSPYANFHSNQQQVQPPAHHPGMYPHGQQQAFQQPQAQGPLHQGSVPPQHQAHPQPPLRPQGPAYMQQPIPGRPHQPGQGIASQQAQTRPVMVSQGVPQQPNQNNIGRATSLVSLQQSQPPITGSQGGLTPATLKQGGSTPDKSGQGRPLDAGSAMKNIEETKYAEKNSENALDSKSEGEANTEMKDKVDQAENDDKRVSETITKDGQVKVEEGTTRDRKIEGGEDIRRQQGKSGQNSGEPLKVEDSHPPSEFHPQPGPENSVQRPRTNQGFAYDAQIAGNIANNVHYPQQVYAPCALEGGQLQQQSSRQNIPTQAHAYTQPGYNDRNPSQFPQQYAGTDARLGLPPGVTPHMPDPSMISQRPSAPDRRFPEPPPYQMHVHGHAILPSQMRPPGHNLHETFPHQGKLPLTQETFWPPPSAAAPGQALPPPPPPPPGGIPSHHGFPPKGFEHHAGQGQNTLPPPHVAGARAALGESWPRPVMGGPPSGAFDKSATVNAMESEGQAINRSGVYDSRQPAGHHSRPPQDASYGQPNAMKMNGMANSGPIGGGMHDPAFSHGFPEERFRPFPEERFKSFPEERFKVAPDENLRPQAFNRKEFEEDLKQFPRPAHWDGEGPPRFDAYVSSSRPLDRMPQQPGGVNAMTSRPLSAGAPFPPGIGSSGAPFPPGIGSSGAPFPPGIGSSGAHQDTGVRDAPMPLHEHIGGRKHDGSPANSDRLNLVSEFGHHRVDSLPPLRNSGHFGRDMPDGLPTQLRRGFDGFGPLSHGFSSDMRGNELRGGDSGGFRGPHDVVDPRGPGFDGRFNMASRDGDMDTFDQSRKWKTGSMVRCLICKIDCETVEGLDNHSLTREHQKMAMDMVLSIKNDNAKKHKSTSENVAPFEQGNKSWKGSFEKRTKRQ